jgi:hypothetical protein
MVHPHGAGLQQGDGVLEGVGDREAAKNRQVALKDFVGPDADRRLFWADAEDK